VNCHAGCKLFGAYRVAVSVKDSAVLIHSTVGCNWGTMLFHLFGQPGDVRQAGTVMYEQDIAFGGEKQLRHALADMLELYDAQAVFVLGGCAPAIIGDDIAAVAKSVATPKQVYAISAAGFAGHANDGVLDALQKLINELPDRTVLPRSVNLIGLFSDDFMVDADLASIRSMLSYNGISVNAVVPYDKYDRLQNIAASEMNIVFDGFEPIGKILRSRFGTPYCKVDYPYGIEGSNRFVNAVCSALKINPAPSKMQKMEDAESKMRHLREILYNYVNMPVAVLGDIVRLHGFCAVLEHELGLIVEVCADTADSEEENYAKVRESNAVLLFGSSFERNIAKQLGIPLIRIAYPVFDKVHLISCGYAGFSGLIRLCEDIINAALQVEP